MKWLVAAILTAITFNVEAKTEHFPLNSKQACEIALKELYVDGAQKGWQRVDQGDRSYFLKDGYVGYFSKFEEDNCVLTSELLSDFQKPIPQPQQAKEEGFCSSSFCKIAVGVVTIAAIAYGIRKIGPSSSGVCDYTWQTARDGSRCGNRAAIVRPGGKF